MDILHSKYFYCYTMYKKERYKEEMIRGTNTRNDGIDTRRILQIEEEKADD